FVSKEPSLPPLGWKQDKNSKELSWISPSGGYVDFVISGKTRKDGSKNMEKVGKDPESAAMGCPVADLQTVFVMKLNSDRGKDISDLLSLARRVGIPNNLEKEELNSTQVKNLELVKQWVKLRLRGP